MSLFGIGFIPKSSLKSVCKFQYSEISLIDSSFAFPCVGDSVGARHVRTELFARSDRVSHFSLKYEQFCEQKWIDVFARKVTQRFRKFRKSDGINSSRSVGPSRFKLSNYVLKASLSFLRQIRHRASVLKFSLESIKSSQTVGFIALPIGKRVSAKNSCDGTECLHPRGPFRLVPVKTQPAAYECRSADRCQDQFAHQHGL